MAPDKQVRMKEWLLGKRQSPDCLQNNK